MRQQILRNAINRAYDLQHQADSAVSIVASLWCLEILITMRNQLYQLLHPMK